MNCCVYLSIRDERYILKTGSAINCIKGKIITINDLKSGLINMLIKNRRNRTDAHNKNNEENSLSGSCDLKYLHGPNAIPHAQSK